MQKSSALTLGDVRQLTARLQARLLRRRYREPLVVQRLAVGVQRKACTIEIFVGQSQDAAAGFARPIAGAGHCEQQQWRCVRAADDMIETRQLNPALNAMPAIDKAAGTAAPFQNDVHTVATAVTSF